MDAEDEVERLSRPVVRIEIFQELHDNRAVGALVESLAGDDSTVRKWAAGALADLRATQAVPALWRA
ncbi:hypothetical protein AB0F91_02490 [Amycolatopsis sp. NPDC023774]|uniref:hypothetical protein n=1 Tax=Amycolatopsis sp. NPDC023774 TaxID=3155015 RepID=UPI0033E6904E